MYSRLGKGLDALFKDNLSYKEDKLDSEQVVQMEIRSLRKNPFQPRKIFADDKIDELAQSIKEHGVLQPIIITKVRDGIGYYIVAGERRYKACAKLGLTTIPAIIRDIDQQFMAEIALLENLQRENLTVIEEAQAYKMLINEYNLTQQDVADKIGKSRSHITNILRVLTLPKIVQDMLGNGEIEFGHAKILAGIEDINKVLDLAQQIKEENLSVRHLEQVLKGVPTAKIKKAIIKSVRDANLDYLEEQLTKRLGTQIKIAVKDPGGKLIIDYSSTDDLNRILKIINMEDIVNLTD